MNETLYRWTFNFHKVVRQQNSCVVEDFVLSYSAVYLRIQKWKNYWNRSTFAKVIVKIKVAQFFLTHSVVSKATKCHCGGTVQSQGGRVGNVKQVGFEQRSEDSYGRCGSEKIRQTVIDAKCLTGQAETLYTFFLKWAGPVALWAQPQPVMPVTLTAMRVITDGISWLVITQPVQSQWMLQLNLKDGSLLAEYVTSGLTDRYIYLSDHNVAVCTGIAINEWIQYILRHLRTRQNRQ